MKRAVILSLVILVLAAGLFAAESAILDKAPKYPDAPQSEVLSFVKTEAFGLYFELLSFRNDPGFILAGFGVGGPYKEWREDVEALRTYSMGALGAYKIKPSSSDGFVLQSPGQIWHLGSEYSENRGSESDFSLRIKNTLDETFGRNKYRHE